MCVSLMTHFRENQHFLNDWQWTRVKVAVDTTCFCRLGSLKANLATLHASLPHLYFFWGITFLFLFVFAQLYLKFAFFSSHLTSTTTRLFFISVIKQKMYSTVVCVFSWLVCWSILIAQVRSRWQHKAKNLRRENEI